MALQLKQKKILKPALQTLLNDFKMLKSGEWVPDKHSCEASMDNVRGIAKTLGVELEEDDG